MVKNSVSTSNVVVHLIFSTFINEEYTATKTKVNKTQSDRNTLGVDCAVKGCNPQNRLVLAVTKVTITVNISNELIIGRLFINSGAVPL